jgi:hypothetical protein
MPQRVMKRPPARTPRHIFGPGSREIQARRLGRRRKRPETLLAEACVAYRNGQAPLPEFGPRLRGAGHSPAEAASDADPAEKIGIPGARAPTAPRVPAALNEWIAGEPRIAGHLRVVQRSCPPRFIALEYHLSNYAGLTINASDPARSLSEYAHCPLEAACSAEYFVALRSQRYGVAPSSRLVSSKHSAPNRSTCILRQAPRMEAEARSCRAVSNHGQPARPAATAKLEPRCKPGNRRRGRSVRRSLANQRGRVWNAAP